MLFSTTCVTMLMRYSLAHVCADVLSSGTCVCADVLSSGICVC